MEKRPQIKKLIGNNTASKSIIKPTIKKVEKPKVEKPEIDSNAKIELQVLIRDDTYSINPSKPSIGNDELKKYIYNYYNKHNSIEKLQKKLNIYIDTFDEMKRTAIKKYKLENKKELEVFGKYKSTAPPIVKINKLYEKFLESEPEEIKKQALKYKADLIESKKQKSLYDEFRWMTDVNKQKAFLKKNSSIMSKDNKQLLINQIKETEKSKVEPKKVEPKKVEPKKEVKKVEPKKEVKKVERKKVEPKKVEPKKSQAQIKKDEKLQKENIKNEFIKTGKLTKSELPNFFKTLDNITSSNSKRRDKQFTDKYGSEFLKNIFGQQTMGDFYSTPRHCLEKLNQSDLNRDFAGNVLEISAGLGSMIHYFQELNPSAKITAIELNKEFSKFLTSSFPKVDVKQGDFFEVSQTMYKYDKNQGFIKKFNNFDSILANPPFTDYKKPKFYLDFLWRSLAILSCSTKKYEKSILFICPPLNDVKKIGKTIDPYKIFDNQSKKHKEEIFNMYLGKKKPSPDEIEIFESEILPAQIMLIGECKGFGGTNFTASIYHIIAY